jgi:hypothetical protein
MAAGDMTAADDEINLEELMAELADMAKEEEVVTEEETTEEEVITENEMEEGEHMEEEMVDEVELNEEPVSMMAIGAGVAGLIAAAGGLTVFQEKALSGALGPKVKSMFEKLANTASSMQGGVKGAPGKAGSNVGAGGAGTNEAELNEALETVETLRKELNETNLLNAKLLYVNKVFKANNLNESQKANVIAAFDKAETVKEVKLVFETVSENVPSGNKKEVVREARGFASAAVGKSDKPEVITEANDVVLRMQKLAGIIK